MNKQFLLVIFFQKILSFKKEMVKRRLIDRLICFSLYVTSETRTCTKEKTCSQDERIVAFEEAHSWRVSFFLVPFSFLIKTYVVLWQPRCILTLLSSNHGMSSLLLDMLVCSCAIIYMLTSFKSPPSPLRCHFFSFLLCNVYAQAVLLETSLGNIAIDLYTDEAPKGAI